MSKLLRPRDRILLGLAIVTDILDEIRLVGDIVPKAYETVYGFTPNNYKKENMYATVNKMLKATHIEKVMQNGEPVFRITSSGRERLNRDFPLINLMNKKWDGKWRIVIFDIPEKTHWIRDSLRHKLKNLGFGMVQESVWISPHPFEEDVREYIKSLNLDENVLIFVSNSYFAGDVFEMAEKVWNLEELNQSYENLFHLYDNYQKGDRTVSKKQILDIYLELKSLDPYLPKEILPKNWWGDKVKDIKYFTIS